MVSNELVEGVLTVAKLKVAEANEDKNRDVILYEMPSKSDVKFTLQALLEIHKEIKIAELKRTGGKK